MTEQRILEMTDIPVLLKNVRRQCKKGGREWCKIRGIKYPPKKKKRTLKAQQEGKI